jgi:putative ABC transport system permease protein
MSYVLALRRREFGLRVALGATRARMYGLVFRYGAGLTIAGLAVGLAGAAAASRALASLLYETSPADALAWSGMAALVLGASALACVMPARRSARVDPIVALRGE